MNASGKTLMANTTASNVKNILPLLKIHPYLNDTLKQKADHMDLIMKRLLHIIKTTVKEN
jgi:hypothetical protein